MYGKLTTSLSLLALAAKAAPQASVYTGELNLEYIRHGMTCANFVYSCTAEHNAAWGSCLRDPRDKINAADPFLTNEGILESREVAKQLDKADIVFSSNMMSGIETALELFPEATVFVSPWVMNLHKTKDKPQVPEEQMNILRKYAPESKVNRVNYNFVRKAMDDADMECDEDTYNARCAADWDNWKKWFYTQFMMMENLDLNQDIPKALKDKILQNQPIKVIVVGHGTQLKQQMIYNNDIKLPSHVAYRAKFVAYDDNLHRVGGDWKKNENDMFESDSVCNIDNDFIGMDRCIGRNPNEMSIITQFYNDRDEYSDKNDDCPEADENYAPQLPYPEIDLSSPAPPVVDSLPPTLMQPGKLLPTLMQPELKAESYNTKDQGDVEDDGKNGASTVSTMASGILAAFAATFALVM